MNLTTRTNPDAAALVLAGRFDAHEVDGFRHTVEELVAQGHVHLAVDLSDVNFVDSSALAELVRGLKRCRERGGDVVLVAPSDPVHVILELTGLDRAFDIADAT